MAYTSDQYSHNDATVVLEGKILMQSHKMSVNAGYEQEVYRGRGGKVQGINKTLHNVNGTIGVLQGELLALFQSYGESLWDKYFTINWVFAAADGIVKTHKIVKAKFQPIEMSLASGDSHMEIDLNFIACDFEPNK